MSIKEVPVLLLTGYLGSGKTTLVNRILTNKKGIKFAVIVNDIGEVNIDAELIQKGGVVGKKEENLVALQNGCICCTLKTDLIEQLFELMKTERFDYIVIEASGICEPEPIAQTICSIPKLGGAYTKYGICRLDNIVTVVDALRMQSEFSCAEKLTDRNPNEDDIENLIIQQIEFCNTIVLNKVSEVSGDELQRIKNIIRALQPTARILECDYAEIELDNIINTRLFNFERVATSAGWIKEIEKQIPEEDEEDEEFDEHEHHHEHDHEHHHHHDDENCPHCNCHHHHHHHGEGEAEEYGISTFVYYRRQPLDLNKFDRFIATKWPASVIRAKGICYFKNNPDMSFLFEQAGIQKSLSQAGLWYATYPEEEIRALMMREPGLLRDWDDEYGDRMQKIVFIGQNMDKEGIIRELDNCLG